MDEQDATHDDLRRLQALRLVAGELEADEATRVRQWLGETPEGAALLQEIEAVWTATAPLGTVAPIAWDTEAAMRRFRTARTKDEAPSRARTSAGRWLRWRTPVAIAATLAVVVVGRSWWRPSSDASPTGPAPVSVVAAAGRVPQLVSLPDGSQVLLAPGSTLRSASGYGAAHRLLELSGEAQFTVARGPQPFRVRSQGVVVEDVSTRFVVRARQDSVMVAVVEGVVVVGARRDTLRQGTGGVATVEGLVAPLDNQALHSAMAFVDGRIEFADEPLREVAQRLSRWTGARLDVSAELATQRVTVTFAGESPRAMFDILATTVGGRLDSTATGWRLHRRAR